ncbi:hypothetical protein D3C86_2035960 [compost metagenome]
MRAQWRTQRGKWSLRTPAKPWPLTMLILAQVNCTATIMGKVTQAVQSAENPIVAPVTA